MPQLDIAQWPPQLVWLAITFAALYFVVSRMIIPGIGGAIAARKTQVESDLAAAQRLKLETEKSAAAYDAAIASARSNAHGIGQQNRASLGAETDKERAALDVELAAKIAAAEKTIAASKGKALEGVRSVAAEIASDIVEQLTGTKVARTDAEAAVAKVR